LDFLSAPPCAEEDDLEGSEPMPEKNAPTAAQATAPPAAEACPSAPSSSAPAPIPAWLEQSAREETRPAGKARANVKSKGKKKSRRHDRRARKQKAAEGIPSNIIERLVNGHRPPSGNGSIGHHCGNEAT